MSEFDAEVDRPASEEETVAIVSGDLGRRRRRQRMRRLRPFVVALLVAILAAFGFWAVYFSSWVTVQRVEVTGNTTISTQRIVAVARAPIGRPLARVDLSAIQARIEALPPVASASVSRAWPHAVRVDIVERVPIAVVRRGQGSALQAVDADGVLFGSYRARPADLPLVLTEPAVKADVLAEAARVVSSLRTDIAARVSYVDVQTIDRISLRMKDGRTVLWGSSADSDQKAEVLAVLLKQKVHSIDVSVPGRPTTR